MRKSLIVSVYVEKTTLDFDKPFSYSVPFDMCENVKIGQRVLVPFGKGNRKRQGVVVEINESKTLENEKIKPIFDIIDDEPVITDEMLKLAQFISDRCFSTFYESLRLMLPLGINVKVVKSFVLKKKYEDIDFKSLSKDEHLIIDCINNSKGEIKTKKLLEILGADDEKVFTRLIEENIIETKENAVRRVSDASMRMVTLNEDFDEQDLIKYTVKQKQVVSFLKECQTASVKEVAYFTGVSPTTVSTMIKQGKLTEFEAEVLRSPYEISNEGEMTEISLTDEQQKAFSLIKSDMKSKEGKIGLLFGVTGSGKTQVFLRAIDECINAGKGAIVMVPEIALTPQTMSIFSKRYGRKIAIFHSAMSLGARMDEWKRVKSGDATIAIGTRSAVFAPVKNLGLIIMDEEQEHTYKSEASPRFHARDVAKFRSKYHNCLFMMASATPSVETYSLAKSGFYSLYTLKNRYGSVTLPQVYTANMRQQYQNGNFGIFSDTLVNALADTFNDKKQAIILLNRRGYQVVVTCSNCGQVKQCPNCSISMTYHTANNRMMCHYCGYSEEYSAKCSSCGEDNVRLSGFGTQKAQEELSMLFPNMRILRMDADTTMTRNSHEKKLTAFKNGEYDVMIGTQMVAKGLDFPNVTLVGVLNADQLLYGNDFRGYEKTFSLLTQVIGRSGRSEEGIAVIQTISPENEIISLSCAQDYEEFYETEILQRKILKYPPYCDLCVVGFSGVSKEKTEETAQEFFDEFKQHIETDYKDLKVIILGPSPCNIPKVNNRYRYRLIIKCKNNKRLRELITNLLVKSSRLSKYRNISVFADMNPENII
ncbi:MAG: primosomal protein N' [Clostridia bacterium]|nr:primosomal protein N' [Clostridia bacterium]